jgi:tripartite-type tricarboxylate transporter receptor subunit TctC
MRRIRRTLVAALLSMGALPWPAAAADPPVLRIVVGFPPGGATDVVARLLADKLKGPLGQTVIVDNKAGAGGMIATQQLKAAPPDGTTVMLTIDHSHVIVPLTFKAPGYDPLKDFTALAGVATYYNVMAVPSAIHVKTTAEFGAWLKANPARAHYGIPAVGSVPQFAGVLVGKALGTPMTAVPYRGGAPLVQDLLANQVPAGFLSLTESIDHHRAGRMHVLAVSGTTRAKAAPDIPTFQELGIKGIDKNPWLGFFGPKGLPPEFVDRFTRAVAAVLADPEVIEKLATFGNVATYASPAQLQEWVSSATAHWGAVVKESGFELQ